MTLCIKDKMTDELVRKLARNRHVGITQAIRMAVEEALASDEGGPLGSVAEICNRHKMLQDEIREMSQRVAQFGHEIDRQFGSAEGRTKVVVDYFADVEATVFVAQNDDLPMAADAPSLEELRGKLRLMAATVLEIDPTLIEIVLRPVKTSKGYKFASPEDELSGLGQKTVPSAFAGRNEALPKG